jgi:glycosyltransferase involved in cell wall biosynthesis
MPNPELVIGIDASRNRSGGAKRHLVSILGAADPRAYGIREVHVWSYKSLLDALPDAAWLVRHGPRHLEQSLLSQLWWQYRHQAEEARAAGCDIMLYTDAGTLGRFRPCVVMSRDMLTYAPTEVSRYRFTRAWLRLWFRYYVQASAMRRADGVVFLTEYAAAAIQPVTGPLGRVAVISHGVGEEFRDVARASDAPGNLPRPVRCLYVSNVDRYKHQWHVVSAVAALRRKGLDVVLTLAGGGAGSAQARLDAEIARLDPGRTFVRALGFVEPEHLPALLQRADIFVFASSCENMPNTLVEGMAAGLPIACSGRRPMPDILEDGGVYFEPEDPDSIAGAIEALIVDDGARRARAQRAFDIARQFSWARCADQTWRFLRATAGGNAVMPS